MNIDQSSNNRQILIDQIISLTCELSETSIVSLKEIAQQLANDQYSEQHTISKWMQLLQKLIVMNWKSLHEKVGKYQQIHKN